ncbi:HK97 family phage prohead protease [Acuticoccus mangrovi]|uniref:HK97 family phage prohead protease n=1 Tax=Acuticoccus mangrovi TaxID=2796142 RepID=A0A934MJR9_9HYPH|nr:HK97 family phage prohead protease [Acuticoccus mangrovi]MBJ3774824.1 HK97 family phage prohead protease [Acuticoccus mangrovi]
MRRARAPETKFASLVGSVDAEGRFCGYASLFGRVDLSGDVVMAGAFARSLREKGLDRVGMLLEHDPGKPIGTWLAIEEDRRGLWVEGRLGRSATAAAAGRRMAEGRLDGLSIGFRTVAAEEDRRTRVRRLIEIDLWEVSVVSAPMLPEARARAAGSGRGAGGEASGTAVDAGLIARLRRTTALLRQTR